MKKRLIAFTVLLGIIGSTVFGCGNSSVATNGNDVLNSQIQSHESIELEIAVPKDEEQGTTSPLTWTELASLYTYQETLRGPIDSMFNIDIESQPGYKIGMLYQKGDNSRIMVQNNTLKGALENTRFRNYILSEATQSSISTLALNTYTDLDDDTQYTNTLMAINGYFNLLPDTEEGYANPDSTLTRAEFMALVMRAETPVDRSLQEDETFTSAVGESEYNLYAQYLADYSYLTLEDSSLNNQTYNGTISRAEAIYMLMAKYYAEDMTNINTTSSESDSDITLSDAKDGGDIATEQGYTDSYKTSYELAYALNNPDEGLPTSLYSALLLAKEKGFIGEDTRWDEGLTKVESLDFLLTIYSSLASDNSAQENQTVTSDQSEQKTEITEEDIKNKLRSAGIDESEWTEEVFERTRKWLENDLNAEDELEFGETRVDELGGIEKGKYDYGKTPEELAEDWEDGMAGGEVKYNEDGTTYIVWDDGRVFHPGDTLPNGFIYGAMSDADWSMKAKELDEALKQ